MTGQTQNERFFWRLSLGVFAIFMVMGLTFLWGLRRQNTDRSWEFLEEAGRRQAMALHQQIDGDFQVMRGVALSLAAMDLDDSVRVEEVLHTVNQSNHFIRMGMADLNGRANLVDIDPDNPIHRDVDFSGQDFLYAALEGRDIVSPTMESPLTGDDINCFAVPVRQDGRVAGALVAVNQASVLENLLPTPVFRSDGHYALVDAQGRFAAVSGPWATVGASIYDITGLNASSADDIRQALSFHTTGRTRFPLAGATQMLVLAPLEINGWTLVCAVPAGVADANHNQSFLWAALLVAAACVAFVVLLAWQAKSAAKTREELKRLAYTDRLTGIRNHDRFLIDAEDVLQRHAGEKLAVWSFDIRDFSRVNDLLGNAAGNRTLQRLADLFQEQEDGRTVSGRMGADLFGGIRPYSAHGDFDAWFAELCAALNPGGAASPGDLVIESAMGVYCVDEFDERPSVDEMLSRASTARKTGKKEPGNTLAFFSQEMDETLRWEAQIEAEGEAALKNGEITFYLQPKVSIQGGNHVAGAEALARWLHPRHGMVQPFLFIPLFEENGFIVNLDRSIFEQVCAWYADRLKTGALPAGLRLAVNVSRQGLLREDLVAYYVSVKERYGIPEKTLELEFTEGVVQNDFARFSGVVQALQEHGFVCSIDDFGSGYSSLNVLKNLPIDVLKLDAVFFRDSRDLDRERTVISDFIALARKLGIRTVAEGVETPEQVAFLREAKCDLIQGYVFSKPLPRDAFEAFAREEKLPEI